MRLRLLFLLALSGVTTSAFAQAYEPGLLVRAKGDTLRGEIENGFWVHPPAFIRFRPAPGAPSQQFQPRQLRAVSFTSGRYFRYEALPIDHAASTNLKDVLVNRAADVHTDSLLAEVLLDGPVMLWRVVRPSSTHYLLRRTAQPILDLCERKYISESTDGGRQLRDGNNYRGQLRTYFGDCPPAFAAAGSASFTAAGIASVVQAYDDSCARDKARVQSWVAQAALRRRLALQGGLLAGIRYNHFKEPAAPLPQTYGCTDCRPRPFAGLYADLFLPSRRSALYGELSLSTYTNQSWGYFQVNNNLSYYVINYRAWLASARLGLRFFFPLPHEQQWLLGFSYELNTTIRPRVTSSSSNVADLPTDQFYYGRPALLPNLNLSWRSQRLTLGLDGQVYTNQNAEGLLSQLVGSDFVARFQIGYRLGRNPDVASPAAR